MNLVKLFAAQKVLRETINYKEPDRFNKLILAAFVELGELANEQRSWKFWSKDQTPRTHKARAPYMDLDDAEFYNPVLEEYVDLGHFNLELGLECGYVDIQPNPIKAKTITEQFILIFDTISRFEFIQSKRMYQQLWDLYVGLGEMLGFTWEEVEAAYFSKNLINHKRQEVGY